MADFFDVVQHQRACRSFAAGDVPDDILNQVLDAATFAPSAENKQPWVFVVVRSADTRKRIAALTRQVWEGGARAHEETHLDRRILADELAEVVKLPEHVKPFAVVFLGWPAKRLGPPRRTPFKEKTFRDRYGRKW